MSHRDRSRRLRWVALFQTLLALPMSVGAICCRDGEAATFEMVGACPCAVAAAAPGPPAFMSPEPADCGPCRDEAITALAGVRGSASLVLPIPLPLGSVLPIPDLRRSGPIVPPVACTTPPSSSQTILRC